MKTHFAAFVATMSLTACVATDDVVASDGQTSEELSERVRALRLDGPTDVERAATRVFDGPIDARPGLEPVQLALWQDPEFQKDFTQSYIATSDVEPGVTSVEQEQLQQVLALISEDKLDEAIILIDSFRSEAASAAFDYTLANIYFERDDLEPAAAAYFIAVTKYPKFQRAWKNLALIHLREGNFSSAVPAFTRVVELGGGDALTYGLLGVCHSNTGNHLAAESAFRMATLLDPATGDWKKGLAGSLFKQERFADAVALVQLLIDESPEEAELWLMQASAYIGLGEPMRAAENYELADRLGGANADSLNNLADIYLTEQLFDLAVSSYARALERDAQAKPARAVRAAQVLTARGALDETSELVAVIERLRGDGLTEEERKVLLKLRARIAVANGASDEEARVLEDIVALDPLDGEALILLGQHANRGGDLERAVFFYERAAGLEAFEADAKVRHAQLLVGQGKYNEALPLLRRAQTIKPRENIQEYLEQVERVSQG